MIFWLWFFFFFSKKWVFILIVVQWNTMYFYSSSCSLTFFPSYLVFNRLIIMNTGVFFFVFLLHGVSGDIWFCNLISLSILTFWQIFLLLSQICKYLFPSIFWLSPLLKGPQLYITIWYQVFLFLLFYFYFWI